MAEDSDCDTAIQNAYKRINDKTELYRNVTKLIEATLPNVNEDGVVLVTGYSSFFGDSDNLCNNVSWSVWTGIEDHVGKKKQYLTVELRSALNDLVRSVNEVIRQATEAFPPNVRFIDYYDLVELNRGRYCESGIHEPDPSREGLDFYEWNTVDSTENSSSVLSTGSDVPKGSFEAGIAELINKTLQAYPDLVFAQGYLNKTKAHQIKEEGLVDDLWDFIFWRKLHWKPKPIFQGLALTFASSA
jgi:hypothetical protein